MREQALTSTQAGAVLRKIGEFLLPFVLIGLVWEGAVRLGWLTTSSLPAPSVILTSFWNLTVVKGVLLHHLAASFYRLAIGYVLAVILGISIGALLSLNPRLHDLFEPLLGLLISVPTIAWVPALLVSMGLGDRTVITVVFLGGFFAITYNTMRGIEMVPRSLVNAARLMGLRGTKLFFKVLLPGSLLSLITGLRLGIGYAWRALVGGEMLSAMIEWGLGRMVFSARFFNDTSVMLVGVLIIGLSGLLLDRFLLRALERATVEQWGVLKRDGDTG